MSISGKRLSVVWVLAAIVGPSTVIAQKRYVAAGAIGEITQPVLTELWRQPKDIRSENLFYGPGGKAHEPHGPFTFVKEDLNGTNPKYDVRDQDGVKWKIKLGAEARPETVATRFVWAVGYHADEDYFLPEVRVMGLPGAFASWREADRPGWRDAQCALETNRGREEGRHLALAR